MKYIRTKDGKIFRARKKNLIDTDELEWEAIPKGCLEFFTLNYKNEEILKIADTIEELCDEFVIFDDRKPFNEHYPFLNKNYPTGFILAQDMAKASKSKHLVVYGAIWTDKGLIYVAKMNEKGELELL